jgi:hypothetical protein
MDRLKNLTSKVRSAGPYLLIELLLPGGTLIALLLWLSQGMIRNAFPAAHQPVAPAAAVERVVASPESFYIHGSRAA